MSKQDKSQKPSQGKKINLSFPKKSTGHFEKGKPDGSLNEGYQPTRNENPTPPGVAKPSDKD